MKSLALFLILFTLSIPGHGRQWLILSASEMNIRAGSLAGHAFVTFLRDSPTSKKIEEVGTWGFYPKDGGGIFSIVPGEIRMDTWRERSASFTVAVSQQEFTNAYRVMEKWNGGNYLLTGSNCVNFLKEIISVIPKLAPPNIVYQAPVPFINKLSARKCLELWASSLLIKHGRRDAFKLRLQHHELRGEQSVRLIDGDVDQFGFHS